MVMRATRAGGVVLKGARWRRGRRRREGGGGRRDVRKDILLIGVIFVYEMREGGGGGCGDREGADVGYGVWSKGARARDGGDEDGAKGRWPIRSQGLRGGATFGTWGLG